MNKSIKDYIDKLKDYADCALASYAMLHYIFENEDGFFDKVLELRGVRRWNGADKIRKGFQNKNGELTAYAKAIEVCFNEDKVIGKSCRTTDGLGTTFCSPKNLDNEIKNLPENISPDELSSRTKEFTDRFEVKQHQKNTTSGFSATLFKDTKNDEYIVSFRGTEGLSMDVFADIGLAFGNGDFQANAMKSFLIDIAPILNEIDSKKIVFVGHSLGGYLATLACQACDTIDRTIDSDFNQVRFQASKVYTFNAPAVGGSKSTFMKFLASMVGRNIDDLILNPSKLLHIYDNGGAKIIASAQYGTKNSLPIDTGESSHSIIYLIHTLYFYSYLLELSSNQEKVQDKSLIESIEYLNKFASNVKKYYATIHKHDLYIDSRSNREHLKICRYLPLLLSDIAKSLKKNNLLKNAEKYSKIDSSNLADFIMELIEEKHFIKILEAKDLKEFCDIHKINDSKNKAYKEAFADFRPYIFTDSDDNPTQTQIAYSYNSNTFYKMCNNQWGEEFIKSQYGTIKGLYFDGKVFLVGV